MAKKRRLQSDQQKAFEQEQLNRPVRTDGEGESEAVKTLLSPEFEQMSNLDATSVALLLQEIIRGQNSLLARVNETGLEIAKLKEHQAHADQRVAEMVESSRKEIEEVLSKSSKLKATGDRKDKIVARGAQQFTEAVQSARAKNASDKLLFEQQLKNMPKEQVISPGSWIQTKEGMRLIPEEVRIKHKVWYLQPGVPTIVPVCVAEALRSRRQSQAHTDKLRSVLGKQMEQEKLNQAWQEAGEKSLPMA